MLAPQARSASSVRDHDHARSYAATPAAGFETAAVLPPRTGVGGGTTNVLRAMPRRQLARQGQRRGFSSSSKFNFVRARAKNTVTA